MTRTATATERVARRPLYRRPLHVALGIVATLALLRFLMNFAFPHTETVARAADQLDGTWSSFVLLVMTGTMGAWGVIRASSLHPLADPNYLKWLQCTPWQPALPLPCGPALLVWEDLGPLVATFIVCRDAHASVELPLAAFVVLYAICQIAVSARAGVNRDIWYTSAAAWAGLVRGWPRWSVVASLLVALLALSQLGIRRSLRLVPYALREKQDAEKALATRSTPDWLLGPRPPTTTVSLVDGLLLPTLIGWWVYCVMAIQHDLNQWRGGADSIGVLLVGVSLMLGMFRWVVYTGQYHPPINLWGRLWTGRLIIPGYDYVAIAPLLLAPSAAIALFSMRDADVNPPIACGVATALVLALMINLQPTLRHWQLTGHHRITSRRTATSLARKRQDTAPISLHT
jgi:hypothetical protein